MADKEYTLENCCLVSTDDSSYSLTCNINTLTRYRRFDVISNPADETLSHPSDSNIKLLTHYKNIDVFVKSSPPTPWTPRPASVSFLLVEEEQQKQQVIKERGSS